MFPVTPAQQAMLLGSHEMSARTVAFRGGVRLGDIPVVDLTLSATLRSQGGRDGRMTVPSTVITSGFLNPLSDQVIVYTGVKGVFEVPIGTFRVDTNEDDSEGYTDCLLLSRGGEVTRAAFSVPWAAMGGNQARVEMSDILKDVDSSWGVDYMNAAPTTIPPNLVWEQDRGQALDQLAQAASLIWQPDRVGGFVIYNNPYAIGSSLGANPVVTLRDGVAGTTVRVRGTSSRDGIWNQVTVVTERVNNTAPIRVTVQDNDPLSPTRWGGLFGKQNLVIKNQVPLDALGSQVLATRVLRQSLALVRSFDISCPHLPILDPGDVFTLIYQDQVYSLVAEVIDYSYAAGSQTSISARELREISIVEMLA